MPQHDGPLVSCFATRFEATFTDRAFILRHLDEAIKIVHLQEADDSHLYEA